MFYIKSGFAGESSGFFLLDTGGAIGWIGVMSWCCFCF